MDRESQRKILGAFVIGIALVGGAYTVANFGAAPAPQPAAVIASEPPPRMALPVTDEDDNGVEDWRDQYFTNNTTVAAENLATTTYTPPETLTERAGTEFVRGILENRIYGAPNELDGQLIDSLIQDLDSETAGFLYDTPDISIISEWQEEDIVAYANVMGRAISSTTLSGNETSIDILNDVIVREQDSRIADLSAMSEYYATLREQALTTPVPAVLAKEHLDLINTYHAMSIDIAAMTQVTTDPLTTMMRLRRYEDNALGLQLALQNMRDSLEPYRSLFSENDPALIFSQFELRQQL